MDPSGESNIPLNESYDNSEIDINLMETVRLLLKKRILLIGTVSMAIILSAVIVLMKPDRYRSTASILPTAEIDKLSGIKQLAGIDDRLSSLRGNPSRLFPIILRSNLIKDAVLDNEYIFTHDSKEFELSLKDYFNENNRDILRKKLDTILSVNLNKPTGMIYVSVETRYPELSRKVLNQIIMELESYNLASRNTSAEENYCFLERKLAEKEKELKASQDSLKIFQMANRNWYYSTDPGLLNVLFQLKQNAAMHLETYKLLRMQYESARFDVQKNIPVVRMLDPPSLPIAKSGPYRLRTIILAGVITFIMTAFFVIVVDAIKRNTGKVQAGKASSLKSKKTVRFREKVGV